MTTVVIDRRGTVIEQTSGALRLKLPDGNVRHLPLHQIDRLVILSNVSLSSSALIRAVDAGTSVLLSSSRGSSSAAWLHPEPAGAVNRRIGQHAKHRCSQQRIHFAARMVRLRIQSQRRLLRAQLETRHDIRRELSSAEQQLSAAIAKLDHCDNTPSMRGIEGAAANTFFRAYAAVLPPSLKFSGRKRRPPPDPTNAMLSFGYTLLHFDAVRALRALGLDAGLGCLHDPMAGRDSLACDLVEPARWRAEELTRRLLSQRIIRARDFDSDGDGVRMNKLARSRFLEQWESQAGWHRRLFRHTARHLAVAADDAAETA